MPTMKELDWGARAFSMLLHLSLFQSTESKKKILAFLMEAPDSIKARVTDFDVQEAEAKS